MTEAGTVRQTASVRATRREWAGLCVIALPCMLYSMDLTVLNLAVPTLTQELKPSASQLLWIVDIYGFMVAGFLMTMGTLGDRIGRRKLLMLGAAAFGLASAIAAFSNSAEMLIAIRAVLGIAGATLAPSTLSLIAAMFTDEKERTFAISMWVASFSAGGIVGPVVGGVLIEYFHWGSVFLIAVPPMVLLLLVGPKLLPEYKSPDAGRLDLASAGLSLAAVLSVVYGVKRMAEFGFSGVGTAIIGLGICLAVVCIRRQARIADPMIDLALFRIPAFGASLAINLAGILFMFGSFIFIAQYFQLVAGLTPLQAGLWSLPSAIAFTVASFVTPMLVGRFGPARLIVGGLLLAALGFIGLALSRELVPVVLSSAVFSVGFTPVISLTTGLIVGAAPPERAGVASAMSETGAELGGALGVALLGSLGTSIYRARMADATLDDVPALVLEAARATLGGAWAATDAHPAGESAAFLAQAQDAFMSGFQAISLISVAGMLLCAAIAFRFLRKGASAAR
jgi:MFS transporter, DHA2 family, multidrug resistance protein